MQLSPRSISLSLSLRAREECLQLRYHRQSVGVILRNCQNHFDWFNFIQFRIKRTNNSTTPWWLCICCDANIPTRFLSLSLSLCVCEECLWLRYHCQSFGVILWKLLGTLRMFFFLFIEWLIIINLTVPQVVQSFDVTNLQSELSRLRGLYTTCCMGAIGGPPPPT